MSMQALNQLVARSIIDPGVVKSFHAGTMDDVISGFSFSAELRTQLTQIEAGSWAEFAVMAYRVVQAAEQPVVRIELPSPVTGLLPHAGTAEEEQAA
jgi:hypothetical protein